MSKTAEAAIFAAELGHCPELDLHGENVNVALSRLESFIHHEVMQGTPAIKIIHGRGTGKLQTAIQQWLRQEKVVIPLFRSAEVKPYEQGAVIYAALIYTGK